MATYHEIVHRYNEAQRRIVAAAPRIADSLGIDGSALNTTDTGETAIENYARYLGDVADFLERIDGALISPATATSRGDGPMLPAVNLADLQALRTAPATGEPRTLQEGDTLTESGPTASGVIAPEAPAGQATAPASKSASK